MTLSPSESDLDRTDRTAKLRGFFARMVTVQAGAGDPRIEQAFAAVPREVFAGPAPWLVLGVGLGQVPTGGPSYVQTPDGDPAFLYQDTLIALDPARGINIGQPSLHALCLDALAAQPGETVLQVGTGSGYYTAILAYLVGPEGHVHAFEVDPALAARTERNLGDRPWVQVHARSGMADGLPKADAIYVNAGITQPSRAWLDALRGRGRLLFPLQPEHGYGGMLMMQKPRGGGLRWPARFVSRAGFIACQGRQVPETGRGLAAAFAGGDWAAVKSIGLDARPDESCWFDGGDWWLSTAAPA